MKLKILVVMCVWGLVYGNIDNSFLENELSEYTSLRGQVETYLGSVEGRKTVDERMKGFSF